METTIIKAGVYNYLIIIINYKYQLQKLLFLTFIINQLNLPSQNFFHQLMHFELKRIHNN